LLIRSENGLVTGGQLLAHFELSGAWWAAYGPHLADLDSGSMTGPVSANQGPTGPAPPDRAASFPHSPAAGRSPQAVGREEDARRGDRKRPLPPQPSDAQRRTNPGPGITVRGRRPRCGLPASG